MILVRVPYRVSFFGGGSDYPSWLKEHAGAALNATINKYCYISVRNLPPFFEHKFRVVWSRIENVKDINEIYHPSVRECLRFMGCDQGLEIHHDGDVPAQSGLGTSSAFTVGLLSALHNIQNKPINKMDLGLEAVHVEQDLIKEAVGCQDQLSTSIGGLNFMEFAYGQRPVINSVNIKLDRLLELQSCLMLVFTGFPHMAPDIASTYNFNKEKEIIRMIEMAYDAEAILKAGDLKDFGRLLHESWQRKKSLSAQISSPYIDFIYDRAMKAGALGGKINGAGGAGFMTLFAEPDVQPKIKEALLGLLTVPFKFENNGAQVVFQSREG